MQETEFLLNGSKGLGRLRAPPSLRVSPCVHQRFPLHWHYQKFSIIVSIVRFLETYLASLWTILAVQKCKLLVISTVKAMISAKDPGPLLGSWLDQNSKSARAQNKEFRAGPQNCTRHHQRHRSIVYCYDFFLSNRLSKVICILRHDTN